MKTKPEIAKAILERRNRMTHVVMPGEINAAIGPDGVIEALNQRWLVPDVESGFLCTTNDLSKLEEMRKLAEMKPEEYVQAPVIVTEGHDETLWHTNRRHAINEIAAPMTGGASPGLTAIGEPQEIPQPSQSMQRPTTGQPGDQMAVGTTATVARQGVKAVGVIEKIMPDGRYQLGFAGSTRPPGDSVFSKEEMSAMPDNPQHSTVTAP